MMFDFSSKQNGFTLIEALVAIVILTIAVLGPLGQLSRSISDARYARNQIIAYHLAAEGLDMVISARTYNLLQTRSWLADLDSCINSDCYIDSLRSLTIPGTNVKWDPCPGGGPFCVKACLSNNCPALTQSANYLGVYSYEPNQLQSPSPFIRQIKIDQLTTPDQNDANDSQKAISARVTSTVTWREGALSRRTALSTLIFNFKYEETSS